MILRGAKVIVLLPSDKLNWVTSGETECWRLGEVLSLMQNPMATAATLLPPMQLAGEFDHARFLSGKAHLDWEIYVSMVADTS